jgi:hypothetical protein
METATRCNLTEYRNKAVGSQVPATDEHSDLAYDLDAHASGQPGLWSCVPPGGAQGLRHPTRALSHMAQPCGFQFLYGRRFARDLAEQPSASRGPLADPLRTAFDFSPATRDQEPFCRFARASRSEIAAPGAATLARAWGPAVGPSYRDHDRAPIGNIQARRGVLHVRSPTMKSKRWSTKRSDTRKGLTRSSLGTFGL